MRNDTRFFRLASTSSTDSPARIRRTIRNGSTHRGGRCDVLQKLGTTAFTKHYATISVRRNWNDRNETLFNLPLVYQSRRSKGSRIICRGQRCCRALHLFFLLVISFCLCCSVQSSLIFFHSTRCSSWLHPR